MNSWSIRDLAEYLDKAFRPEYWRMAIGFQDGSVAHDLVQAVLAEHPADEDEPWGPLEATYRLPSGDEIEVRAWNGPGGTVVNDVIIDAGWARVVLLENPTKGQVRKLVAVLGAQEV